MKTKELTLCAFMCVLYIVGSKIVIPAGLIPLTLQTMMVIIAGVLLTPKQVLISYGLFLAMGLIGFPVFANGGGIAYVLQPSFGFLLSFPIAACFISFSKQKFHLQSYKSLAPVCLLSLFIIYAIGCVYMYGILNFYMGVSKQMGAVISIGALPFMISDTLSILTGCFIAMHLSSISVIQRTLCTK